VNTNDLLDSFNRNGKSLDEFAELLADIDNSTIAIKAETDDLTVYSIDRYDEDEDVLVSQIYTAEQARNRSLPDWGNLPAAKIRELIGEEGLNELRDKTRYVLRQGGKFFFPSSNAIGGIAARAGLGGEAVSIPEHELFALIMRRYTIDPHIATLIVRQSDESKGRKVIACRSEQYAYIPQSLLCSIIDGFSEDLGSPTCKNWEVSQFFTRIYIEFPKVAKDIAKTYGLESKIMPGVILCTSDSGESSITARGTFKIGGRFVYTEEYKHKHQGAIDLKKILKSISKSVFDKYTAFPQRLMELLEIDIADPYAAIESTLRQINFREAAGKRLEQKLTGALLEEINPSVPYTAYDICMSIISLPDRFLEITESTKKKMQLVVYKAAFADYDKAAAKPIVTLVS
jgi:hypothetical protein